ncbi:hypothetical protein [uncultured Flavobacterium sp.]|jgi:hypothetical protein|uniref:hypothetical protein n=1 Tax=uncultured Flavobacterium sp. TaxID=165435 RepID=UPI0025995F26|nr:hypothetical protein [uncultured Flavobacterium sp.]
MKTLLILITLSIVLNNTVFVEGKNYKGYIFSKEYENKYFIRSTNKFFTPTVDDIKEVEKSLIIKAKEIKKNKKLTQNECWNYNDLYKYNRQYFGEFDENGNKLIFINFVLKKSTPDYWNKEIVVLLEDNCKNVWNDKILIK